MSTWYDPKKERYRESIPYKIFYRWLWPIERWFMFHCMSSEQAHWFGIHIAIPVVGFIDCIWAWSVTLTIIAAQLAFIGFFLLGVYCAFVHGIIR